MNLAEIRQKFAEISGRYDLVTDANAGDWSDNGANFYIQNGQHYLDQRIETKMSMGVFYKKMFAGRVGCSFPDCRAVREVWYQDQTNNVRLQLTKRDQTYFRKCYPQMYSSAAQGKPLDYYLPTLRVIPDNLRLEQIESYIGFMDTQPIKGQAIYNGIVIMPPADIEIVVEIHGLFSTQKLVEEMDENIWSINYSSVLVWAALRELEITYRNTEGAKDWENAINSRLIDIDKDLVEEDIAGVDKMEG